MQGLVSLGDCCVVVGERESVEDVAEDVGAAVGADDFCHVGQRSDDLLGLVDVSVLCHTVLTDEQCIIDVYVASLAWTSHEDFEVFVGDSLLGHVLCGEVQHHVGCGV